MPNPGNGTNAAGDTPQEVLFIVTDGVVDEVNSSTCTQTLTGSRCQEPITPSLCTAIKNRGIRIAVLYTTYLPVTERRLVHAWIAPFKAVEDLDAACKPAPRPACSTRRRSATDLGAALSNLFKSVTQTARLTQLSPAARPRGRARSAPPLKARTGCSALRSSSNSDVTIAGLGPLAVGTCSVRRIASDEAQAAQRQERLDGDVADEACRPAINECRRLARRARRARR